MRYSEDEALLAMLQENPHRTQSDYATLLGWKDGSGRPYRVKVQRALKRLESENAVRKTPAGDYTPTRDPVPYSPPSPNALAQVELPSRRFTITEKARGIREIATDLNRLAYELRQIIGIHDRKSVIQGALVDLPNRQES